MNFGRWIRRLCRYDLASKGAGEIDDVQIFEALASKLFAWARSVERRLVHVALSRTH
jgi:hypothetical protein